MTKKTVLAVLLACVMALAFGCATAGVTNLGTQGLPDGSSVTTLVSTSPDPWQLDGKAMDRFQTSSVYDEHTKKFAPKSQFVVGNAGFADGLGKQLTNTAVGSAIQGASIVGAGMLLRPSSTNVNAGNNSGNQEQAQGVKNSVKNNVDVKNVNINKNANKVHTGGNETLGSGNIIQ
jgi:hypothetical protein